MVRYSVNEQVAGHFEVLLSRSLARRLGITGPPAVGLPAGSPPQLVIAKAFIVTTKGGRSTVKIQFSKRTAQRLAQPAQGLADAAPGGPQRRSHSPATTTVLSTLHASRPSRPLPRSPRAQRPPSSVGASRARACARAPFAEDEVPQRGEQQVADDHRDEREDREPVPLPGGGFAVEGERQGEQRQRSRPPSADPYSPGQWRTTKPELSTAPTCQREA